MPYWRAVLQSRKHKFLQHISPQMSCAATLGGQPRPIPRHRTIRPSRTSLGPACAIATRPSAIFSKRKKLVPEKIVVRGHVVTFMRCWPSHQLRSVGACAVGRPPEDQSHRRNTLCRVRRGRPADPGHGPPSSVHGWSPRTHPFTQAHRVRSEHHRAKANQRCRLAHSSNSKLSLIGLLISDLLDGSKLNAKLRPVGNKST
jgi:hypothetical protein